MAAQPRFFGRTLAVLGRNDGLAAAFNIVAYSVCSSTMLVANKIAVRELPVPALVRCA